MPPRHPATIRSTFSSIRNLQLQKPSPRAVSSYFPPAARHNTASYNPPGASKSSIRAFSSSSSCLSPSGEQLNASSSASSSSNPQSSSTVPSQQEHFATIASEWWDPHGSSGLLHQMNPLRHDFIRHCLSSSSPSSSTTYPFATTPLIPPCSLTYLDIGCGGGIFTESCARLPTTKSITGIEPTTSVLNVAQVHAKQDPSLVGPSSKLRYLNTTIEDLSSSETADILTLFEVIEHVSSIPDFLSECMKHVRPGGWIIGSTIARTWVSWLTTKLVAEDILRIVPRGTHEWERYVDENELRGWFEKQRGWGQWQCWGVLYVPGVGWKVVPWGERVGNYFWGVRRLGDGE